MRSFSYQAHIDGLRGVAVLLIVAFHAFPTIVPGGFVGVDVFFVISGFLLTSIILQQKAVQEFSLAAFYARRIRRIFPALLVVLLACYAIGWFVLLPAEFRQLGKHMALGAGFLINFQLWTEAGYFDTASELKPLLHLWSLAVEEQFYLFLPLLLTFAHRWRGGSLVAVIVVCISSLLASVSLASRYPVATFFLPYSRVWELLLGSLLAFAGNSYRIPKNDACAWAGLGLIGAAGLLLHRGLPYPSFWALLPTTGAFLLLAAGTGAWVNQNVLAWRPMVLIGLISFPLYLWHWPLLSFARLIYSGEPDWSVRLTIVGVSVLLAVTTYCLVEWPIRHAPPTRMRIAALLCLLLTVSALGYHVSHRDGLPFRMQRQMASYEQALASVSNARVASHVILNECSLPESWRSLGYFCQRDKRGDATFALIGDSHATALFHGLVASSSNGPHWELIGRPGCTFPTGAVRHAEEVCNALAAPTIAALVNNQKITGVLYAMYYRQLEGQYTNVSLNPDGKSSREVFLLGLSKTFDLLERSGKQIHFLIDNPFIVFDARPCLANRPYFVQKPSCSLSRAEHDLRLAPLRQFVEELKAIHPRMRVFDPTDILCSPQRCDVVHEGKSLYADNHHLSDYGSELVANGFLRALRTGSSAD